LHRFTKKGAHAAPFFFPAFSCAMSATLICAQIGESRSKVRAFGAGSSRLLPVFLPATATFALRVRAAAPESHRNTA
jgi:hypothetical protein